MCDCFPHCNYHSFIGNCKLVCCCDKDKNQGQLHSKGQLFQFCFDKNAYEIFHETIFQLNKKVWQPDKKSPYRVKCSHNYKGLRVLYTFLPLQDIGEPISLLI